MGKRRSLATVTRGASNNKARTPARLPVDITVEFALPEQRRFPFADQAGVAEQWMRTMGMPHGDEKIEMRRNLIVIAHRRGWKHGLPVGWDRWLRESDPEAKRVLKEIRRF